jgi:hypothetical protein
VKFIKSFHETWDEYKMRVEDMNERSDGQIIIKSEMEDDELVKNIYWRENYDFVEYLTEYVNRRLCHYDTDFMKRCCYRENKRKERNEHFASAWDDNEKSSNVNLKRSIDERNLGDSDSSASSEHTKRIKLKGKERRNL